MIRMAYADDVEGPWAVYESSTVALKDAGFPLEFDREAGPDCSLQNLWNNHPIYIVWDMLLLAYRSDTGVDNFIAREKLLFGPDMRHAGLWLKGNILSVFWSRVGDALERTLVSEVDLTLTDWNDWQATQPQELLRAELRWEGSELRTESSLRGELGFAANELRDPFVFEENGEVYPLYTDSGEQAIGLARLREVEK